MREAIVSLLITGAIVTGGAAILAAPAQDRPGQVTPARVWIENRDRSQAIPVIIEGDSSDTPLRVQVSGTSTVAISSSITLPVRAVRQGWEYLTLNVPTGQDPIGLLAPLGALGWEATGIQTTGQNGSVLLLKRPL